jgi:site-specific DNA recombinase
MDNPVLVKNAVGAIRVSTTKQGINGDSPEDQKNQIDQYAASRGARITKYFLFLESASKELQPMQEVVDYCKDPRNDIQQVIIKSIDRFTRGGSEFYNTLKNQLDDCGVSLVDIYGIISSEKVNTLEHLGVKYKWSEYSPTKKSEILEAERAKDEIRDIQTRMIGAQIRYARLGYWVRRPLIGFNNVHVETRDGKRCILEPNEQESPLIEKMFELRARGTMEDTAIVDELNKMGFRTRKRVVRDKQDRTKIVKVIGGEQLTLKTMWGIIENPVYAGINPEKWTQGSPVRCKFDGLVSVQVWNAANRGKFVITEADNEIRIDRRKTPEHLVNKGARNADFPYKRIIMCPECVRPLYGSASKGRHGGYYPAYHCDHRGHYFRKTKKEFDQTIEAFVQCLTVAPEYIDALEDSVGKAFDKQLLTEHRDATVIDLRMEELQTQVRQAVDKIKFLNSEATIKYVEEDIMKIETEIKELEAERVQQQTQKPTDMTKMKAYVRYYLENLDKLLLHHSNPVLQAKYFGVIFNKAPTYADIVSGTPDPSKLTEVNEVFKGKRLPAGSHGWG